jgi:hypothetical protein
LESAVFRYALLWLRRPKLALGWSCAWGIWSLGRPTEQEENTEKSQIWKGDEHVELFERGASGGKLEGISFGIGLSQSASDRNSMKARQK